VENLSNGMLLLQYLILVADVPEPIGMEIKFIKSKKASNSICKIARIIGEGTAVTLINVTGQEELNGWTFGDLASYFNDKD
jgi:hypothetical protein